MKLVLLDIRSQEEWDAGHFDDAIHVPTPLPPLRPAQICVLSSLLNRIVGTYGPKVSYAVYCKKGKRSSLASAILHNMGVQSVRDLGGVEAQPLKTLIAMGQSPHLQVGNNGSGGSSSLDDAPIRETLISFFQDNPRPSDPEVHQFAERLGIDKHRFEEHIYALLSDSLKNQVGQPNRNTGAVKVGKHRDVSPLAYDPRQLRMGLNVQMQHTDDSAIAMQIAKDHLAELPDYYTRLRQMQQQGMRGY